MGGVTILFFFFSHHQCSMPEPMLSLFQGHVDVLNLISCSLYWRALANSSTAAATFEDFSSLSYVTSALFCKELRDMIAWSSTYSDGDLRCYFIT